MRLNLTHTEISIYAIRVHDVTDYPATDQCYAFTKMVLADADGGRVIAYLTEDAKRDLAKGLFPDGPAFSKRVRALNALDYLSDIANLPDGQTVTINAEDARRILGAS